MHNASALSDEELMARHAAGEPHAFSELYPRVFPFLIAYLKKRGADGMLAEDLVQTTMLRAHLARDRYAPDRPLRPWLVSIARNALIDHQRRGQRSPVALTRAGCLPDRPAEAPAPTTVSARILVDALPETYASAIRLAALEGHTHEEVARKLRTTRGAVKLRVHRGYKLLRNLLSPGSEPDCAATAA